MKRVHVLIVLFLLAILAMGNVINERFSSSVVESNATISLANTGPEPWNHHEISSIPSDTVTQYPQTYYNEFSNEQFEHALRKTFPFPCDKKKVVSQSNHWMKNTDWRAVPNTVRAAYDETIRHISTHLKTSQELHLPYDNPLQRPVVQMVHDRWNAYYTHSATNDLLLDIEFITFRETKFQGKHIVARSLCEWNASKKKYDIFIVEIHVQGVVSEDQIGMHPVLPNNPFDLKMLTAEEPYPLAILDATTLATIVNKQQDQQKKDKEATIAIASSL